MLAFQQLADALGGQLVEAGGALVIEAKGTAAAPGVLDDGVVGQGFGHGDLLFIVIWGLRNLTVKSDQIVGAGLLAIAVYQLQVRCLNQRYREQARSHISICVVGEAYSVLFRTVHCQPAGCSIVQLRMFISVQG
jgi:hypothetical protein